MQLPKYKKKVMFVIISYSLLSFLASYFFMLGFIEMLAVVYLPPVIFLAYLNRQYFLHILFFSIAFGVLAGGAIDLILTLNGVWHVPTVFSFRFFDLIPVEDLIWSFLIVFFVISYYEYFFDKNKFFAENKFKKFGMDLLLLFVAFTVVNIIFSPEILKIPYIFVIAGLVLMLIIPSIIVSFNKRFLTRFLYVAIFFFFHSLIFEITSLSLGHWEFVDGQYIGWVSIFDNRFPFEEFFFWPVLFSTGTLAYYEFFYDTKK